jgi:hypothetical protein
MAMTRDEELEFIAAAIDKAEANGQDGYLAGIQAKIELEEIEEQRFNNALEWGENIID